MESIPYSGYECNEQSTGPSSSWAHAHKMDNETPVLRKDLPLLQDGESLDDDALDV
jgi:hypothetical protein